MRCLVVSGYGRTLKGQTGPNIVPNRAKDDESKRVLFSVTTETHLITRVGVVRVIPGPGAEAEQPIPQILCIVGIPGCGFLAWPSGQVRGEVMGPHVFAAECSAKKIVRVERDAPTIPIARDRGFCRLGGGDDDRRFA